jgi:superfamily II DNA or RNA helicase
MIRISVHNDYSYIFGEIYPEIIKECTLSQIYFYRDRFKKIRVKEKSKCYFNKKTNSFPTGWLYSKIVKVLKLNNIPYEITDYRSILEVSNSLIPKFGYELRPYQVEASNLVIGGVHRGIISIGTGGGKTTISGSIVGHFNLPTLIMVPNLLLLNQTYKSFCEWFDKKKVGYIGEGVFKPSLFTVATEQTLWSRIDTEEVKNLLTNIQVLILDEAHHIQKPNYKSHNPGNTWYLVAMNTPNARVRIGLTATPGKEGEYSRQLLEAITGKVVFDRSLSWLMENKYLSKLKVYIHKIKIDKAYPEWEESYEKNILKNELRNKAIVDMAKKLANDDKRVLIIVNRIDEHGEILTRMLGRYAESLYGEDSNKERVEVLDRFVKKETKVVVSTIIREGVDLPEMDAIIIASGGKGGDFGRDLQQKLGRVVRLSENKSGATLVDFYDDDGYTEYIDIYGKKRKKPNILLRHSVQRLNIYRRESQFEIMFI